MIGIAIAVAIVLVLAWVVYHWNKRRQSAEQTQNPLFEKGASAPATPEDKLVLRLIEKIKAASTPFYFGTFESRQVFSNGHFLEFAESLPTAIERLRDPFAQTLPEETIRQSLPPDADSVAEEVQSVREEGGKYELSSRNRSTLVDGLYYDYLKMRYPKAKVFCRGKAQPVTFSQEGVVRAVLMPMKK